MRIFFSAQLSGLFLATPWIVGWLSEQTFRYATGLFWVAVICMAVQFILMTCSLYTSTEQWKW